MKFDWKFEKRHGTTLYYMIATFLFMVALAICLGLIVLPCFVVALFNSWCWLFLWFITLPLCIGVSCKTIEILN